MIVQSAPDGEPRFAITMSEHTVFAGALARAFGNDNFEPVSPRDEVLHIVDHHDDGWAVFDVQMRFDPATRYPYHLVQTPLEEILKTSARSPTLNEQHHPYCGLLSSMHSWGLYNGRYGLSDHVLIDAIDPAIRPQVDAMLDGELERQTRLKAKLADDPKSAGWLEERHLMQNYKQLQFFDTLALYFHCNSENDRGITEFPHVPKNATDDVVVKIELIGSGTYALSPYPFDKSGIEIGFSGRYIAPIPEAGETDLQGRIKNAVRERQSITFVAG